MANQSINILNSIPQYIVAEYPLFVDFISAYYEYMQQTGKAGDFIENALDYSDIDTTLDGFLKYFKNQFMDDLPSELLCDERLLLKHIKELYRTKGSEASYKLLFRALYNKDVSITTPNDNILRPSDGKWEQHYSICVSIPKSTASLDDIYSSINNRISIRDTNGRVIYATVARITELKPTSAIDDGNYYLEFYLINNLTTIKEISALI